MKRTAIVNDIETTHRCVYTKQLKKDLAASLEKRFAKLIEDNDVFIISTLLDPNFGKRAIPLFKRESAVHLLKLKLIKISTCAVSETNIISNESKQNIYSNAEKARERNYLFYDDSEKKVPFDDLDSQIKEYFLLIENNKYKDALLFWRLHYKSPSYAN